MGRPTPGRLLALEGGSGSGCSTQAAMLREWFEIQGQPVLELPLGMDDSGLDEAYPLASSLWGAAELAKAVEQQLTPALQAGFMVLVHPYVHTLTACCRAQGLRRPWLRRVFSFAPAAHTLYLRISPQEGLRRVLAQDGKLAQPGSTGAAGFLHREECVQRVLDDLAGRHGFHVLDAGQQPQAVQEQLRRVVGELLAER